MNEPAVRVGILWVLVVLVLLGLVIARNYFEPYWTFWIIVVLLIGVVGTAILLIRNHE